ncbi:MAG TPA: LysM peptidoglycan-binding domain-containing protein [Mycobacterium sp.]|uniref:LysM peptidoglycan-binding domain-containing protein n=1 Tax=Mycobacterium sp. TaxID=1785 RepID=UPI002F41092E
MNCARIAVGGLVLAEITGGLPAVPAYASTPVVLAASHHGTHGDDKPKHHHAKKHHHPTKHHRPAQRAAPTVTHAAVRTVAAHQAAAFTPAPQPAPAAAPEMLFDHYIVQPGDTLTHIAAAFGLPFEVIWAANGDRLPHPDAIFIGQRLRLPA